MILDAILRKISSVHAFERHSSSVPKRGVRISKGCQKHTRTEFQLDQSISSYVQQTGRYTTNREGRGLQRTKRVSPSRRAWSKAWPYRVSA